MQTNTKYEIIEIDNKEVTFDMSNLASSKSLYINATEIAKKFNKQPKDWLRLKESREYMEAISQEANLPFEKLTNVIHGGTHKGTWLHSDLYIVFARWLNPTFAVKCDKKIREILEGNSLPQEQNILPVLVEMAKVNQMLVQSNQEIVANLTNMNAGLHEMLSTIHNIKQDTSRIKRDIENVDKSIITSSNLTMSTIRCTFRFLSPVQIDAVRKAIDTRAEQLCIGTKTNIQSIKRAIYSYINSEYNITSYYHIPQVEVLNAIELIENINIGVQNA